jgi:hypothetical protein
MHQKEEEGSRVSDVLLIFRELIKPNAGRRHRFLSSLPSTAAGCGGWLDYQSTASHGRNRSFLRNQWIALSREQATDDEEGEECVKRDAQPQQHLAPNGWPNFARQEATVDRKICTTDHHHHPGNVRQIEKS